MPFISLRVYLGTLNIGVIRRESTVCFFNVVFVDVVGINGLFRLEEHLLMLV